MKKIDARDEDLIWGGKKVTWKERIILGIAEKCAKQINDGDSIIQEFADAIFSNNKDKLKVAIIKLNILNKDDQDVQAIQCLEDERLDMDRIIIKAWETAQKHKGESLCGKP